MSLNTGGFQQQTGKITLSKATHHRQCVADVGYHWAARLLLATETTLILWRDTSGNLAAWQMNGA